MNPLSSRKVTILCLLLLLTSTIGLNMTMMPEGHDGGAGDMIAPQYAEDGPSMRDGHYIIEEIPLETTVSMRMYDWYGKTRSFLKSEDGTMYAGTSYCLYGNTNHYRTYMKIPIESGNPSLVLTANLKMTLSQPAARPMNMCVNRVTEYWDRDILNNTNNLRTTPNVIYNGSRDHQWAPSEKMADMSINITETVQEWFDGISNNGLCLMTNETPENYFGDEDTSFDGMSEFWGIDSGSHAPVIHLEYLKNQLPFARIVSGPLKEGRQGADLTFVGQGEDPDGDGISFYEWSSNRDGHLASGPDMDRLTINNLSLGHHAVRLRVRDDFEPLQKWSEYAEYNIWIVENKPEIVTVHARGQNDTEDRLDYLQGEQVLINLSVSGGIAPITGWVNISLWDGNFPVVTQAPLDDRFRYLWDTTQVPQGTYRVDVAVQDDLGEADMDGIFGTEADLILNIEDPYPPVIQDIVTRVDGVVDTSCRFGDKVSIEVIAGDGESELDSDIAITDPSGDPVPCSRLMDGSGSGIYETTWNTGNLERTGVYNIEVTLTDSAGNMASAIHNVTVVDDNAPKVVQVRCMLGSQEGDRFPVGTTLTFMVVEDSLEEGLTGTVDIMFGGSTLVYNDPLTEMGDGRYYYTFQTSNCEPGLYAVNVTLIDEEGNRDPDGLGLTDIEGNPLPDLFLTLTVPPVTLVVMDTAPLSGSRDVPRETVMIVRFSQAVEPSTVTVDTILVSVQDGNPVSGEWSVDKTGTICTFDPNNVLDQNEHYMVQVTDGVMSITDVKATPYSVLFETGISSRTIPSTVSPGEGSIVLEHESDVNFTVDVPGGEVRTVYWSVDHVLIPESKAPIFTLGAGNGTDRFVVTAEVVGQDSQEMFTWTVIVKNMTESGDTDDEADDDDTDDAVGDDDDRGSMWALMAAVIFLVIALVVFLLHLKPKALDMFFRKGRGGGGDE